MDLLGIVSLMSNQFRSYTNIRLIASGVDVHPIRTPLLSNGSNQPATTSRRDPKLSISLGFKFKNYWRGFEGILDFNQLELLIYWVDELKGTANEICMSDEIEIVYAKSFNPQQQKIY
jgi:hypothetical protein